MERMSGAVAFVLAISGCSSVGLLCATQAKNFCSGQTTPERFQKSLDVRKVHLERHSEKLEREAHEFNPDTFDYSDSRYRMNTLSILDDSYVEDTFDDSDFTKVTRRENSNRNCCSRQYHMLWNVHVPT